MLLIPEIITSEMPLKQRVQTPHSQDNWDTIYLVCLSPQALLFILFIYLFFSHLVCFNAGHWIFASPENLGFAEFLLYISSNWVLKYTLPGLHY